MRPSIHLYRGKSKIEININFNCELFFFAWLSHVHLRSPSCLP
jgi:hypothetical protein